MPYPNRDINTWPAADAKTSFVSVQSVVVEPDTLSLSNGYLYFTANQLHRQPRFHQGHDEREKPYVLFRIPIDGTSVALQ